MRIDILTPFPEICAGPLSSSILKRVQQKGLAEICPRDLRGWTNDRHRTTDDSPYGGGPGMVMKIEPIYRALNDLRTPSSRTLFLSPQGRPFDQKTAARLAAETHLIFLCGHYEGVDQRVCDHLVDEEISIGDYVLTNGALAALVVIDAVVRLLPGALGNEESAVRDSFQKPLLDHPHYTKPAVFESWEVPEILLSGNHAAIEKWREQQALERTRTLRPDLLETKRPPSAADSEMPVSEEKTP